MQHWLMERDRPGDGGGGITPRMVERHRNRHRPPAAESGKVDAPIIDRGRGRALGARHLDDLENKIVVERDERSPRLDRITRGNAAIGIYGRHRDKKPRRVVVLKLVADNPADHADLAELLREVRALLAVAGQVDDERRPYSADLQSSGSLTNQCASRPGYSASFSARALSTS